jgi:hypothetical protein
MEVASFLNGKAKSISIIGRSKYPFAHNLGEKIGQQFKKASFSKISRNLDHFMICVRIAL